MKRLAGVLMAGALLMSGCVSSDREQTPPPMEKLRMSLGGLIEANRTNEIAPLLESALLDRELAGDRVEVFRMILAAGLDRGDVTGTQQRYLAATNDAALAAGGVGVIERRLMLDQKFEAAGLWCLKLLEIPLPEAVRERVVATLIESYRARAAFGDLESLMPRILSEFPPAAGRRLVQGLLDDLVSKGLVPPAEKLLAVLAALAAGAPAAPEIKEMVAEYSVRLPISQKDLLRARKAFMGAIRGLSDGLAARLMGQILAAHQAAESLPDADSFCMDVLRDEQIGTQLRIKATRESVRLARDMKKPEETVMRLTKALRLDLPCTQKLALIRTVLYDTMELGDKTVRSTLVRVCTLMREQAGNKIDQGEAGNLLLDACFLAEDFDLALKVVQEGVEGTEPEWKENLVIKVKAHGAMKAGRHQEAAELFQSFLDRIKGADAQSIEALDPSTGLRVTKDEVLGLNAARIGKLWRAAGQMEKAQESLKEARGYYEKALALFPPDTAEHKALMKKIQGLN